MGKVIDLSIIIPVYNVESFLPRCLDSICTQLYSSTFNVELWVVNDGSPDNSLFIMKAYQEKYPHLVNIINKANGGLSDARNAALEMASGRYIWFVDSDDSIEAGSISELAKVIASTKADYILFNAYRVDVNDKVTGKFEHCCEHMSSEEFIFSANGVMQKLSKHMVWLRLFRREFIGSLRFPVGITHEDIHFDLLLLANNPSILYLNGFYYRHFFDNPDSITNTMNPKKHRHVLWVFNDLFEKFTKVNNLKTYLKEYSTIAISTLLSRACYLLSTQLSGHDKRELFIEYAQLIRKLSDLPISYTFSPNKPFQKVIYLLIAQNYLFIAYFVSLSFFKIKSIYDLLAMVRHGLIKRLKVR